MSRLPRKCPASALNSSLPTLPLLTSFQFHCGFWIVKPIPTSDLSLQAAVPTTWNDQFPYTLHPSSLC